MVTKQRKFAGRLWALSDNLAITGGSHDTVDLSLSPVTGAAGANERNRIVVTGWHGAIAANGTLSFVSEVSGTVLAGPFEYQAGAFQASYNPAGWFRGGYAEGLVISGSQNADLVLTFGIEPEDI